MKGAKQSESKVREKRPKIGRQDSDGEGSSGGEEDGEMEDEEEDEEEERSPRRRFIARSDGEAKSPRRGLSGGTPMVRSNR